MSDCLAAYTSHKGYKSYPSYFNVYRDGDEVVITVREPELETATDHDICGDSVSMRMPLDAFKQLMTNLLEHV